MKFQSAIDLVMRRNELPEDIVVDEKTAKNIVEDLHKKIFSFNKDDISNDEDDSWHGPQPMGKKKCNGTHRQASNIYAF
jgi:hypothetical protein